MYSRLLFLGISISAYSCSTEPPPNELAESDFESTLTDEFSIHKSQTYRNLFTHFDFDDFLKFIFVLKILQYERRHKQQKFCSHEQRLERLGSYPRRCSISAKVFTVNTYLHLVEVISNFVLRSFQV